MRLAWNPRTSTRSVWTRSISCANALWPESYGDDPRSAGTPKSSGRYSLLLRKMLLAIQSRHRALIVTRIPVSERRRLAHRLADDCAQQKQPGRRQHEDGQTPGISDVLPCGIRRLRWPERADDAAAAGGVALGVGVDLFLLQYVTVGDIALAQVRFSKSAIPKGFLFTFRSTFRGVKP